MNKNTTTDGGFAYRLGDELNVGGMVIRVVERSAGATGKDFCRVCPIEAMDRCKSPSTRHPGDHPMDCGHLGPRLYAVFVNDIPGLTLKGLLR